MKRALALSPLLLVLGGLFGGGLVLAGLESLGSGAYARLLASTEFQDGLALTARVSLLSALISCLFGTALAVAVARVAGRSRLVPFLLRAPLSLPHLVVAAMVLLVFSNSGILARLAYLAGLITDPEQFPPLTYDPFGYGIIAAYALKEIPFVTVLVLPVVTGATQRLGDVAATLGASPSQVFRRVVWPLVWPAAAGAGTILFAYAFGAFEVPFVVGRTYPKMLPVLAYQKFMSIDPADRPLGLAAGLVIAAVTAGAGIVYVALLGVHERRFAMVRAGAPE